MPSNICLVKTDYWEAVYLNGERIEQDHHVDLLEVLAHLQAEGFLDIDEIRYIDDEYIEDTPLLLEDLLRPGEELDD